MKRYFIALIVLTLLFSADMFFRFHYSAADIGYHLLVMSILYLLLFFINVFLSTLPSERARRIGIHLVGYTAFLLLCTVYLLVLGSNMFWGKTITLKIVSNYLASMGGLISILPVRAWIFYTSLIALFLIITVIYILIRPHPNRLRQRFGNLLDNRRRRKVACLALVGLLLLGFLLRGPLLYVKRRIHFSNEPIFQFALGPMWTNGAVPLAFDVDRNKLGLQDQACIDSIHARTGASQPTVVIILLDALRSDHLSMYGYQRKNSPFLDSLKGSGNLQAVRNGFSTSNMTSGGVAGLFYSRDWEDFGYNGLSLMKFMKRVNYKTYAFLTGFHRDWYDLAAMYRSNCDYYYESAIDPYANNDDDLVTLAEFKKHRFSKNSMIYIHLLSTHTIGMKNKPFKKFMPDKIDIGVSTTTALINNYDNGIVQGDYVISQIFEKLKQDGLMDNIILYVVADHGELFGEDGRWSHGGDIHQRLLNIPIMVYDTARTWYTNMESATIKDVAPSIVDRLGYEVPSCWTGFSLHQPPHDFVMKVNSGIKCDLPKGVLLKKDNRYLLKIMNGNGDTKKTFITNGNGAEWQSLDY